MLCPQCGTENESRWFFCASCGYDLQKGVPIGAATSFSPATVFFAGFWRRFFAFLLDSIIIMIAGGLLGGLVGGMIAFIMGASHGDMYQTGMTLEVVGNGIGIVLHWLYFTLFEASSKQATPGKMALGIMVTDLEGNSLSWGRANGRYWSKIISGMILCIGYIMVAFTRKKQGLHDLIANALVVKR